MCCLKRPAVEPQACDCLIVAQARFDHLEDTRFAGAPVTVDADRQRVLAIFFEQRDDRFGNSLVTEEVDSRFLVGNQHGIRPLTQLRADDASAADGPLQSDFLFSPHIYDSPNSRNTTLG